ncbi:aspartyl-phosphate phosphatase Spo0E family protein [Bacillus sp. SH5-2]|uniref:aspartyl-phosphate phosphatase Spo0E family protein n=1 Tax=Bacillus sp. SH5-2 TaxID=2217834 RepID=UPI0011ED9906|nr:aspartyl-phosphate phosphatase Spo0E family protein [Bacillus sp. SH5-2]KAA0759587.1 aspartyl-phosphate phosphatase Spo0E family protein [Bacillus sp. SH5-2]
MILLLKKHTKTCCLQCESLIVEIEKIRGLMVFTALEKGFTDPKTIEISQKLDQLLNRTN